jgi:hypothetical protein
VVDDGDPVGQPVGLLEVLRREQQGRPAADEVLDHVPQREPAARVEPGRRLVEEEHLGALTRLAARSRRRRMPPL